ncbi:hypothetical protein X946_3479 [Burkholderia sp. ABCPW 111]|nr:hypothetical protein X946_3479 [Burkholderia sp. ABCPW 111]
MPNMSERRAPFSTSATTIDHRPSGTARRHARRVNIFTMRCVYHAQDFTFRMSSGVQSK